MSLLLRWGLGLGFVTLVFCPDQTALAQAFGVELHSTLNPAAGGMGGVSIARPQDLQSAFWNPATLAQFHGTQFGFGGAWVEPTIAINNQADLANAGIAPFQDKSGRPGSALGNIAAIQDFTAFGLPVTWGVGLLTTSGLGVDYRATAASNGTTAEFVALTIGQGVAVQLTDRLALGATLALGSSTLDGVFTGVSAAVPAYALRGHLGLTYEVAPETTFGFYWMTLQSFQYDDAVDVSPVGDGFVDVNLDLPRTFGWGIANESLLDGRLLLAMDILYKQWSETDLFGALWEDQMIFQFGAQYTANDTVAYRIGYVYAQDATSNELLNNVGGVGPASGVNYIRALFPNINHHRISAGVGVHDVLPGLDLDLFAGGMFRRRRTFGETTASIQSYWIGAGLTWRFRQRCCSGRRVSSDAVSLAAAERFMAAEDSLAAGEALGEDEFGTSKAPTPNFSTNEASTPVKAVGHRSPR